MTLYRQLVIAMLLLCSGLFSISIWVQFVETRDYVAKQQETMVFNTATALGLSLTPYLETGDRVGAEAVIKAIFDAGYYRSLNLKLLASKERIHLENSPNIDGIPRWFVDLALLPETRYETTLTSGWLQLGELEIVAHPGQATMKLWLAMQSLALYYAGIFAAAAALGLYVLHLLLRPLNQIATYAEEVELHHFEAQLPLPRTQELRQVVQSLNTLANKLALQFKEQAREAERLRQRAYVDPVTGLGNRAYFIGQADAWLAEGGHGGLLLLGVDALDKIAEAEGYQERDKVIQSIAHKLERFIPNSHVATLARFSPHEFALIANGDRQELSTLADELNRLIAEVFVNPLAAAMAISVIGIAMHEEERSCSALLTKADSALRQARAEELGSVVIAGTSATPLLGRKALRDLVEHALEQGSLNFKLQQATMINGEQPHHQELFTAIPYQDGELGAGQFMPVIEQFNLFEQFDRHVVETGLKLLRQDPLLKLALNLTAGSLSNLLFSSWLVDKLLANTNIKRRLFLEIPEEAILRHSENMKPLFKTFQEQDILWGIDHFGRHSNALSYLQTLHPAYVKLDYGYTSQIVHHEDNAFIAAICNTAHTTGALTFATHIAQSAELIELSELPIDGYQGFLKPAVSIQLLL